MNEEKEQFTGEKLKELRKKHNLKQQEVADGIGAARERISEWENKKFEISNSYQRLLKLYFDNFKNK
jgi:transcriptional regulator with XRE-family HTH domain